MPTAMLPTAEDHRPRDVSGSSWLTVAALAVAIGSAWGPAPFNGASLLALTLLVAAIVRRYIETTGGRS